MLSGSIEPEKAPSWKWPLTFALMLVIMGIFCFVGGVAWQQWKDRNTRRKIDEASSRLIFANQGEIDRLRAGEPGTRDAATVLREMEEKIANSERAENARRKKVGSQ